MKTMKVMLIAVSLVLAPYIATVNAKSSPSAPPPVEQPLVAEGEFAVELANALKLTSSHDEAAAESYLASIDILPRNGWISDYPMTPDIIAEVRESAAKSASLGNLHISGAYAADVVDTVSIAMNLPIYQGSGSGSAAPASGSPEYVEPSVVDEYYADNEPPIVTYYPPPWEYADFYEWVPSPFWWGGFDFGGFFILADFDRHHHHHHQHHHITNHVMAANGTATRVNATTRAGSLTATHHAGSTTNTANTATQRNLTSSGSARDADRMTRNPGGATRDMDRSTSSPRGPINASGSTSFSGQSFSSSPPAHSFTGGGSGGGFHGGGGGMGGFHGGGGGGGGFHGGGGGGGGHR